MSQAARERMTADEFLLWAEGTRGRYELEAGEVVTMAPERVWHTIVKSHVLHRLQRAVEEARYDGIVLADGLGIRVGPDRVYEPDATLLPGPPRRDPKALSVSDPLVVVEVVSPTSILRDMVHKLRYFSLPSLRHYLVIDPDEGVAVHFRRATPEAEITARIQPARQPLRLDPPGLDLPDLMPEAVPVPDQP